MLNLANGFQTVQLSVPNPFISFAESSDSYLSKTDCKHLLSGRAGGWLLPILAEGELSLTTHPLENRGINPLLLEFLTAQAILDFQTPATSVYPVSAIGRIILINYTPWKKADPPIPMLSLTPLNNQALLNYNRAIQRLLTNNQADLIAQAMRQILIAGVDILYRAEAIYYYIKMVSLLTGAYEQRYDP